jgi:hypothetical protein
MGTASLRHGSSVFFVAFLSDGKQVLSAGEDGLARLWDVATGKEVRRFGTTGAAPPLSLAVALSSDGKTLASCDGDTGVRLWDTATGRVTGHVPAPALMAPKTFYALAFSPDGQTLAASSADGLVVLWDLGKHAEVRRLDGRSVAGLLADLDSSDFRKRESTTRELARLGEQAEPALRKALEGRPALETRRRIEALLERASELWRNPSPERVRMLRSLEVLECAGTEEARQVLEALARGAPGARLTEEAKASTERLAGRVAPRR